MDTVPICHGAISPITEQKKASVLLQIIRAKSERNKSEKSIQKQSRKCTFFEWLTVLLAMVLLVLI